MTNKIISISDSETNAILQKCDISEKIETVLNSSQKLGKKLELVVDNNDTEKSSNKESGDENKIKSHLPPPIFKLSSERNRFTFDLLRKSLGSALSAEGFGRGTGKKRYKVDESRPDWFDKALEDRIGIKWNQFTGVNVDVGDKDKKEVMMELMLAIYTHDSTKRGYEVDDYFLKRSAECNLAQELMKKKKKSKKKEQPDH